MLYHWGDLVRLRLHVLRALLACGRVRAPSGSPWSPPPDSFSLRACGAASLPYQRVILRRSPTVGANVEKCVVHLLTACWARSLLTHNCERLDGCNQRALCPRTVGENR